MRNCEEKLKWEFISGSENINWMDDGSLEVDICRQEYAFKTHSANEVSRKFERDISIEDEN